MTWLIIVWPRDDPLTFWYMPCQWFLLCMHIFVKHSDHLLCTLICTCYFFLSNSAPTFSIIYLNHLLWLDVMFRMFYYYNSLCFYLWLFPWGKFLKVKQLDRRNIFFFLQKELKPNTTTGPSCPPEILCSFWLPSAPKEGAFPATSPSTLGVNISNMISASRREVWEYLRF